MLKDMEYEDMAQASVAAERDFGTRPTGPAVTSWEQPSDSGELHQGSVGLTGTDSANVRLLLDHVVSKNTRRTYGYQWDAFVKWAQERGMAPFPANAEQVAAYLAERFWDEGHSPTTLRTAAAAISFVHRNGNEDDPCARLEVRDALAGAAHVYGHRTKQARGLTSAVFNVIRETACRPRLGRGGNLERSEMAQVRGLVDIAMIGLMRDSLLRVSEAADLVWHDLTAWRDGSGRLLIRRSKTDRQAEGAVGYVSRHTMSVLEDIRDGACATDRVFGIRSNQISNRIKRAALQAGFGNGFSGHSPRVGMAQDLAAAGTELPSLMVAGRWRSPRMPADYIRNEEVGRGAVALYYSGNDQGC